MRKVAVFANPLLCSTPRQWAAVGAAASVLRQAGLEVTIQELGTMAEAAGYARHAIANGSDTIISCGGDGTVFALLQALAGSEVSLGIIPMGTGNILAQNMRLPRGAAAAAKALLRSTPRSIPLGKLAHAPVAGGPQTSWFFAMAAGIGAHAMLMQAAERWGKRVSGRAAYYFAGIDLLLRHDIECFEIEVTTAAGETFTQKASEALAVRVAELNRWRPGSDLNLPVLRLAIVSATTRWELARASLGALASGEPALPNSERKETTANREDSRYRVKYCDVTRVVCRPLPDHAYRAAPLLQADGEVLGASNAVIGMAAERLSLLWPDS